MALATSATDNLSGIKLLTVHEEVYRLCACAYGRVVEGQIIVANGKEVESGTHTQRNNVDSVREGLCESVRVFNLDFNGIRSDSKILRNVKRLFSLRDIHGCDFNAAHKNSTNACAVIFAVLVNRGIREVKLSRTVLRDREASVFQKVFQCDCVGCRRAATSTAATCCGKRNTVLTAYALICRVHKPGFAVLFQAEIVSVNGE